jgi:hypothetical protein
MRKPDIENEWLVAIFLLGAVLFNYPILSLFNTIGSVFGVPTLYAYLFIAWGAIIALVAWVAERRQ